MTSLIRYIFGAYPGRDAPIPPLVLPPRPIPSPSSLKRKGPSDGERDDGQDGIRPKFRRVETPSGSMSVSLGTPTKAAPSNFSEVQKQQYVTMWRLLSLNAGFQSAVSKSPGALHPLKELYSERRAAILAAGGSPQVDPFVARKRKVGDDGPADEGEEGARKRHAPERVDLQVRTFSMLGRKRQAEDEGRDDTVVGGSKRKKLEPKGSSLLSGGAPDAPKGRQPVAVSSPHPLIILPTLSPSSSVHSLITSFRLFLGQERSSGP